MSTVNRYDWLLERVEYPRERGHRMHPSNLPPWIYLTITDDQEQDCKFVTVYSRIHVNKEVRLPTTFSREFGDYEIIRDVSGTIANRFL